GDGEGEVGGPVEPAAADLGGDGGGVAVAAHAGDPQGDLLADELVVAPAAHLVMAAEDAAPVVHRSVGGEGGEEVLGVARVGGFERGGDRDGQRVGNSHAPSTTRPGRGH